MLAIFPEINQDENFTGGTKKFVKISILNNEITVLYIGKSEIKNIYLSFDNLDKMKYFYSLLNSIITYNVIYDINDEEFVGKINETKEKITLEFFKESIKTPKFSTRKKINGVFCSNLIINDSIYATSTMEKITTFSPFKISIDNKIYEIVKISKKYYEIEYLKKIFPRAIIICPNKNFYIINHSGNLIGINVPNFEKNQLEHLYDINCLPWESENFYKSFKQKFENIKKSKALKLCLNAFYLETIMNLV